MFSDNTKIGIIMVGLGLLFLGLGILLFFDSGLMAIGNIVFITGIPFIIGWRPTLMFFNPNRAGKRVGVLSFFAGVLLVLIGWPIIGIAIELYGIVELFGTFVPTIVHYIRSLPVVGQLPIWDKLSGREKRPPV